MGTFVEPLPRAPAPPVPASDLVSAPRSRALARLVHGFTNEILRSVFSRMDCLIVDDRRDAEFVERCLLPAIDHLHAAGHHTFSDLRQKLPSNTTNKVDTQHAYSQRITYKGASVDEAATQALANKRARGEATPANAPLLPHELDSAVGGVIAIVRYPICSSREDERRYEDELSKAHEAGQYSEVVRRTRMRTRKLFYGETSSTFHFDRGTLTTLLINSFIVAHNNAIKPPIVMTHAIDLACLVQGSLSSTYRLLVVPTVHTQIYERYVDDNRLLNYAAALRNEEFVLSAAYARVVALLRDQEEHAKEAALLEEIEAAHAERLEQGLDDAESGDEPPLGIVADRIRHLGPPQRQHDGKVTYVHSDTQSINSRLSTPASSVASTTSSARSGAASLQTVRGEPGFARTPFRALEGAPHEFADRLRSPRTTPVWLSSIIDQQTANTSTVEVASARERLIRRFALALSAVARLIDRYYHFAADVWNPLDYFHLYSLCELEMRVQPSWVLARAGRDRLSLAPATVRAVAQLCETNARKMRDGYEPVALACLEPRDLEDIVYDAVIDAEFGSSLSKAGVLFGPQLMLHRVIDNFQMQTEQTTRQRRTGATFVGCTLATVDELRGFALTHALAPALERLEELNAVNPYEPITERVLVFGSAKTVQHTKTPVTPMSVLSTMRAFGARDGDDCLVVWTPGALPPLPRQIYVAMRSGVFNRIANACIPRAIAEKRAMGRLCHSYQLIAPALYRALMSSDCTTVVEALGAVQSLFSRAPAALPLQWQPDAGHTLSAARRAVASLRRVADCLARRGDANGSLEAGRRLTAYEMIEALRNASHGDSLFSAVQVAMAGARVFMFIEEKRARELLDYLMTQTSDETTRAANDQHDLDKLAQLLRRQLASTRSETRRLIGAQKRDSLPTECPCGNSASQCERVARTLRIIYEQEQPRAFDRGMLSVDCCACARVPLARTIPNGERELTGMKRRRMTILAQTCARCSERQVVASTTTVDGFVPIYDPLKSVQLDGGARAEALSPDRIVELLATPERRRFLYALRVGTRADWVCRTLPPHARNKDADASADTNESTKPADDGEVKSPTAKRSRPPAPTSAKSKSASAHPYGRSGVNAIIEATRDRATARLELPSRPAVEPMSSGDVNLLALLVEIEMLALLDHKQLCASAAGTQTLGAQLSVFSDAELRALAEDRFDFDCNGLMNARVGQFEFEFPLCESALVESNGVWRQTAAAEPTLDMEECATALLYAGRTPRPMLGMPQCLTELVMMNWYDKDGNVDDPDVLEAAQPTPAAAAATTQSQRTTSESLPEEPRDTEPTECNDSASERDFDEVASNASQ